MILGDHYASIEDLKKALDYKAFIRADPYMRRTGSEMENKYLKIKILIDKYLYMMRSMSSI